MQNLIHYILIHSGGLIFSICGFSLILFLMERIFGFRHGKGLAFAFIFFVIMLRFFGMELYLQTYLGSMYAGRPWYNLLLGISSTFSTLLGIAWIHFLLLGDLRKKLFTELLIEICISILWDSSMRLFSRYVLGHDLNSITRFEPTSLFIPVWAVFLAVMISHFGEPVLARYRSWEIKHPRLMDIFLVVCFGMGILSSFSLVKNQGYSDFIIYCTPFVFWCLFLWFDYLQTQYVRQQSRNRDLSQREAAMKRHYVALAEQMAVINRYNEEIRGTIETLMTRILQGEGKASEQPTQAAGSPDQDRTTQASGPPDQDRLKEMAARYLGGLKDQYDTLTVHKYCEEPEINELLLSYADLLRTRHIHTAFMFREYRTPDGIDRQTIINLIRWMLDGILGEDDGDPSHADNTLADNPQEGRIILQGGYAGRELILSCQASGNEMNKPSARTIRKQIKALKADLDIMEQAGEIRIVIGIPV